MAYIRLGVVKPRQTENRNMGLKDCLDYIMRLEKCGSRENIQFHNLLPAAIPGLEAETAYRQMIETKQIFGKDWGRVAYHYKLSFPPDENISPELALQVTEEFIKEYLPDYECAYSVHLDTKHLHTHIVFNSIDCISGYKYQYKNGDWKLTLIPILNQICKKYNLSELDLSYDEEYQKDHRCKVYNNWRELQKNGYQEALDPDAPDRKIPDQHKKSYTTNAEILSDVEECIAQAVSYNDWKQLMTEHGHIVDDSHKYITVKAPGRQKACRIINLTSDHRFSKENIVRLITGTYIDRDEVKSRLANDMKDFYTHQDNLLKNLAALGIDGSYLQQLEMARLITKRKLTDKQLVDEYVSYLDAADKELNILRKRIKKEYDAKLPAIDEVKETVRLLQYYDAYNQGKTEYREQYNQVKLLLSDLTDHGYDIPALYKYAVTAEEDLAVINDYKKHIWVEKKICDRIFKTYRRVEQNRQRDTIPQKKPPSQK